MYTPECTPKSGHNSEPGTTKRIASNPNYRRKGEPYIKKNITLVHITHGGDVC